MVIKVGPYRDMAGRFIPAPPNPPDALSFIRQTGSVDEPSGPHLIAWGVQEPSGDFRVVVAVRGK